MATPLRVLILEDRPSDAQLVLLELKQAGFDVLWERVETEPDYLRALEAHPDLILADFRMPQFDAPRALQLLRERAPDIPFIIVSGTIGEETAVGAMREGATDYLPKDRLGRLGQAVAQALAQKQLRADNRRADEALRESLERIRLILDTANDPYVAMDASGRIIEWNTQAEMTFGWSRDEAIGRLLVETIIPVRFREQHEEGLARFLASGTGRVINNRTELVAVNRLGSEFPVELVVWPVRVAGNWTFSAFVRDISQRKRAEEAQREGEIRFRDIYNQLQLQIARMPLAYILFDADLRIIDWNPTAEKIFGYRKDEMLGLGPPWEKVVPKSSWPLAEDIVRRIRSGDMTAHSINENQTKDGRTIVCQWFNTPLISAQGTFTGLLSLAQDITQQKTLEEQFRQAQKMEAVGKLAGGVAHDFNNLLTIILGYSDMALESLRAEDPLRDSLEQIRKAGERAVRLTRQLLAFSRKQVLVPVVMDVNNLLLDMQKMLGRLIGEDVELIVRPTEKLWPVKADAGQIEQVILNLAVNARDAMPQGGKLTIETANVELDLRYESTHPDAKAGQYVRLTVADNGTGMDADTKARIFEPFFTTKEPERGTGLGLATVYGIVKQSDGHIDVYSELGAGTTFQIYLPRTSGDVPTATAHANREPEVRGSGTVLLVEDEAAVRNLARTVLERGGYQVLEARQGSEALLIGQQTTQQIDLLLTDVVMPEMSGRDLAERLVTLRPELKVLYMSGYTDDAIVRHGMLHAGASFVQKPFTPEALARKVREALRRAAK